MKDVNYKEYSNSEFNNTDNKMPILVVVMFFAFITFFWPFTLIMVIFYRKESNETLKRITSLL